MANVSNTTNAKTNATKMNATSSTGKLANTITTAAASKAGDSGTAVGGMHNTSGASSVKSANGAPLGTQSSSSTLVASRDVKDFTLTPPMVDVRGWNVALSSGDAVGTVDRIMLDSRDHMPRYLAVTPSDRKGLMLLPIGVGTADRDHRRVVLRDIKPDVLKSLPLLTNEVVTRDMERSIFGMVKGAKITDQTLPQIYTDPMYDAGRLFGSKGASTTT